MHRTIQHDLLWYHVKQHSPCKTHALHGFDHWLRVLRNGLVLADQTGADRDIVELFALFHDSCRWSDGVDPGHGSRGAELARQLRGNLFEMNDDDFERLYYACTWHQDEDFHDDPNIGVCWDADRLDLIRAGITPDPDLLNTACAKALAVEPNLESVLTNRFNRLFEVDVFRF
ncbi:HD domain-containing protein [Gimesia panareensis]|nr:HD domain-containing protein [Gimesia panareensis]